MSSEDADGVTALPASPVPPSLGLLWGLRDRPRRGPKPGLSIDVIVDAAVRLADAEGLAAVSMSRVAAELGFTTMSLYRYVASKDELLLLMVNSATRYEEPPRQQDETWREAMRGWTLQQMQAIREHIWFVQIPITGVPVTPSQVVWIEHGLRALAETGLTEHEKADIVGLLASYALGQMRLEFEVTSAQRAAAADGQTPAGYAAMMAQLIGAEDYPAMHAAVVAGAFEYDPDGDRELVDFGLERILDGIEVLIERRSEAGEDSDPADEQPTLSAREPRRVEVDPP